jgi:hypothetical protein
VKFVEVSFDRIVKRRRDGQVVVRIFAPIWPVVATSGGHPVEGRGKTESPHLDEGAHASGKVLARRQWGSSSILAMGKSCREVGERLGAPIYRPRSPARAGQRPKLVLQLNRGFLKSSLRI